MVEDAVDLGGELGFGGDERAGVHVKGVESVKAGRSARGVVSGGVGDFEGVGSGRGGERRGRAGSEMHGTRDGGGGEAFVFARGLDQQAASLCLAGVGLGGHLVGHDDFAIVEF